MTYAGAAYWDQYFRRLREAGDDLDWEGRWTGPFLVPLRAGWRPVVRELERDYVLEQGGQTMHFFSERYLRDLLRDWRGLRLERVEITDETGAPFKCVWRGVARR
jgi:hypothetical protein